MRQATTSVTGVVQLSGSVASTSTSKAATSSAVKTAYDAAVAAQGTADAHSNFSQGQAVAATSTYSWYTYGFYWDGSSLYFKS